MKNLNKVISSLLLLLSPTLAFAHTGHSHHTGFTSGLLHPVGGLDHMLLAMGLALLFYRGIKHGSLYGGFALCVALLSGFLFSQNIGLSTSLVEAGIILSILCTAAALFWGKKTTALLIMSALAVFHGMAHGLEMPHNASAFAFMLGMLTTMLGLFIGSTALSKLLLTKLPATLKKHYLGEKILAVLGVGALLLS